MTPEKPRPRNTRSRVVRTYHSSVAAPTTARNFTREVKVVTRVDLTYTPYFILKKKNKVSGIYTIYFP